MAWIIETALRSRYIGRTIVSTDSEEYASIATRYGADVPFLRPTEISTDTALETEYVRHAVEWLGENEGYEPDIVVRLQPTNPMLMPEDIDLCVEQLLKDPDAHSAMVIAEAHQHPGRALKLVDDGKGGHYLVNFITGGAREAGPSNRQSHEKAYFRANIVATRTDVLLERNSQTGDRIRYHIISQERAVDIDSLLDFVVAGQLIKKFKDW